MANGCWDARNSILGQIHNLWQWCQGTHDGDAVTFSRAVPMPGSFFTSLESRFPEASRIVPEVRRQRRDSQSSVEPKERERRTQTGALQKNKGAKPGCIRGHWPFSLHHPGTFVLDLYTFGQPKFRSEFWSFQCVYKRWLQDWGETQCVRVHALQTWGPRVKSLAPTKKARHGCKDL